METNTDHGHVLRNIERLLNTYHFVIKLSNYRQFFLKAIALNLRFYHSKPFKTLENFVSFLRKQTIFKIFK